MTVRLRTLAFAFAATLASTSFAAALPHSPRPQSSDPGLIQVQFDRVQFDRGATGATAVIDLTEGTCGAIGTHEASGAAVIASGMHLQAGAVTAAARGTGERAAA